MTLVSDIITAAYRESNLIPLVATPSAAQITEALNRLNPIILSSVGNEAGDELNDLNYGGDLDQSDLINEWMPDNTRVVLNLTAALTLEADPDPYEGQRLAVVDVGLNLDTYNLIVSGNGRLIEGAASVTLNTAGESSQWLYRGDTGNWVKIESLIAADEMPFPTEFDDYFTIALAMRLNPRYGQEMSSQTFESFKRSRSQLRARYRGKRDYRASDPGLIDYRKLCYGFDATRSFNTGRLWPWR